MKYPKEWVEAASQGWVEAGSKWIKTPEGVLNDLQKVGALKEPPKPREFWICTSCKTANEEEELFGSKKPSCAQCGWKTEIEDWIHVKEVIE